MGNRTRRISQEEQYVQNLDTVEAPPFHHDSMLTHANDQLFKFIRHLLSAAQHNSCIMSLSKLHEFLEDVLGNIPDLRNKRLVDVLLENSITDVLHIFAEIYGHHRKLLDQLHDIQRGEHLHPRISNITAAVFDAALSLGKLTRTYRIDDEMANSHDFKAFVEQCTCHPDPDRLDMKNFINRPVPRHLRYELLLNSMLEETPAGHEDRKAILQALEIINSLGKDSEPGVDSTKENVQLWCYHSNVALKVGKSVDLDLLNENRLLIHAVKLLRQSETGWDSSGMGGQSLVTTKAKEKAVTTYQVNRRPKPLDFLNLAGVSDLLNQRSTSILRLGFGGVNGHVDGGEPATQSSAMAASAGESRLIYSAPSTTAGDLVVYTRTLFTESQLARAEWRQKLEKRIGVGDGITQRGYARHACDSGKVACSVAFNTAGIWALGVAIGCVKGGLGLDMILDVAMRRVLPLKMGAQRAMLEDFGMFLVLADKEFFLPSELFDLVFLKAKIAILCAKRFETMDLTEYAHLAIDAIRVTVPRKTFPYRGRVRKTIPVRLSHNTNWQSNNKGFTWDQKFPGERFLAFYMHTRTNQLTYFITDSKKFFYTTTGGLRPFCGSSPALTISPELETLDVQALFSRDNGRSWNFIEDYVVNCDWARDNELLVDRTQIICESYQNKQGSQSTFGRDNALQLISGRDYFDKTTKLFEHVVGFTKFSEFLIVAEVSLDGRTFTAGQFPPGMHPNTHAYTDLEPSTGSIFLHMTMSEWPNPVRGNLLKSNSNGTYFGLSIENVNRNDIGFVNFDKFVGPDGIAMVNVVANPAEATLSGSKELQTRITHDDGGTWRPPTPPKLDSQGKTYPCSNVGCALHVHGYTGCIDARATYSSPGVVGVVMAVGNVGKVLAPYIENAHLWEFGDSRSIIVIVNDEEPTDHVLFTTDEGLSWWQYQFSNDNLRIKSVITVQEDTSRKFMLLGHPPHDSMSSTIVHIDFTSLMHKECVLDIEDPGHDDFEIWSPIFIKTLYHRRKREANCIVGKQYKAEDVILDETETTVSISDLIATHVVKISMHN
ncbi:hypothetical protein BU15DRAFT_64291 [Melanogaster broomeanus]|nr:hypothetical protein BU15DRAFT_64291 [Melanogaster broomeanus]